MIIKKPPQRISNMPESIPKLFLAGSIEMGVADNWQKKVEDSLKDCNVIIYNPRREGWDSSWEQTIENEQFTTQVLWELTALKKSDTILMYLDPATKSPISLLELGLYAQSKKMIVVCPEGFWRKGNVDIVCQFYNVRHFNTLDEAVNYIKSDLSI